MSKVKWVLIGAIGTMVLVIFGVGLVILINNKTSVPIETDKTENNTSVPLKTDETTNCVSEVIQNLNYEVDKFIGMTQQDAINILDVNSIDYELVYVASDGQPGLVINQSVPEGEIMKSGSKATKIVLTISAKSDALILSDYTGLDYEYTCRELEALGISYKLNPVVTSEYSLGTVIDTNPAAYNEVQAGSTVVVFYAVTPMDCVVPNIYGMTLEEARIIISEGSLNIGNVEGAPEVLELEEKDMIILYATLAPGTSVPSNSDIDVIVGTLEDFNRGGTPTPSPTSTMQ